MASTPTQPNEQAIAPRINDILHPDTPPGDTPDFADEFTTSGTEKNYWKNPINKEKSKELLI